MSLTNPNSVVTVERLAYFWSKVKNGFGWGTEATATLAVASWNSTTITQSVAVSGVTSTNTVIVSPAPESIAAWAEAGVRCTAQGTNSLTFTADSTPSAAITVNVAMF